jgi:hypothetical protein
MAVVRMSDELRKNIESMARASFDTRIDAANKSLVVPMTGDEIYNLMFGDTVNGMLALPDGYMRMTNRFTVAGVNGVSIHYDFHTSQPMPWPYEIPTMPHFSKGSMYGSTMQVHLRMNEAGMWDTLEAAFRDWHKRIKDVADSRDQFVGGVRAILNNNTTLGAAIKQWPPLWDFIPQYAKDKHSQVVEKKKRELIEKPEVDTASLTAMAAFNKMV